MKVLSLTAIVFYLVLLGYNLNYLPQALVFQSKLESPSTEIVLDVAVEFWKPIIFESSKKKWKYLLCQLLYAVVLGLVLWKNLDKGLGQVFAISTLMLIFYPLLIIDIYAQVIPNIYLLLAVFLGCSSFLFRIILARELVIYNYWHALIVLPVCVLVYFLSGRGIGFGDIKLVLVMTLYFKIYASVIIIGLGFILLFIYALGLLLSNLLHKKRSKQNIALAPFLFMGAYVFFMIDII